jgi:hypothetical protein
MTHNTPLDGFTSELLASLSQNSRDALFRRINAERLIKLLIDQLIEKHKAENIRVIPDQQLSGENYADYLIQVDDYDLRLILLDAPNETPIITEQLLREWNILLESNSSTTDLIVVWVNDGLLAIPFTMRQIRTALGTPANIEKLHETAEPFEKVISDVIYKHTKAWKIPKEDSSQPASVHRDLLSIFSEKILNAIDVEANRRYRTEERVKAALKFPAEQEKRTILSILQEALDGQPAEELQKHLIALPHRGEQ